MLESRAQKIGPVTIAGCQNGGGILTLAETNRKSAVPQCSDEACQPFRKKG